MTRLLWDKVGERLYEAGIDRGVLYLPRDNGVPWNGLTGIEEDVANDTSEPSYFDGVKVNDIQQAGDFAATLRAFTYPDEFLEYEGQVSLGGGLYVDDQPPKQFGLSFRTRVGNDTEGTDFGYKVHLLYNVIAVPEDQANATLSGQASPIEFGWRISAVPEWVSGYRPTAHVVLDSRYLPSDILTEIENILYGSEGFFPATMDYDGGPVEDMERTDIDGGTPGSFGIELPENEIVEMGDPRLPSIAELIDLITLWGPRFIVPDEISGLADLLPSSAGDITQTNIPGVYTALPDNRLTETEIPGFYELP